MGESQRKLVEQKNCLRQNWRIFHFLVLKNRKNSFFNKKKFKIPIIIIWPLNSFFPSKTSLYRLKLILRIKKIAKKIMVPFYSCVEPLCSVLDWMEENIREELPSRIDIVTQEGAK
jgi:hypothetical protein